MQGGQLGGSHDRKVRGPRTWAKLIAEANGKGETNYRGIAQDVTAY